MDISAGELIAALQQVPSDATVVLDGHCCGGPTQLMALIDPEPWLIATCSYTGTHRLIEHSPTGGASAPMSDQQSDPMLRVPEPLGEGDVQLFEIPAPRTAEHSPTGDAYDHDHQQQPRSG